MMINLPNISNIFKSKANSLILSSRYISRDLSWLKFNERVVDQARKEDRSIFERLKFMAIAFSNLDEFLMIRVGSLYNYIDFQKERVDYSGLKSHAFKSKIYHEIQDFMKDYYQYFNQSLQPLFPSNGFNIVKIKQLTDEDRAKVAKYFNKTVFPMLTPMLVDHYHTFPILANKVLTFGVVTKGEHEREKFKLSFVQIPQNLPRFYQIDRGDRIDFLPIEEIVRWQIHNLYRNIEILDICLFRVLRNADFLMSDTIDDADAYIIDELKKKLNTRKTGRVVRIDIETGAPRWLTDILLDKLDIQEDSIFHIDTLLDLTGLWEIIRHEEFADKIPELPTTVPPLSLKNKDNEDLFEYLKHDDLLIHHPYNSMEPVIELLEKAAVDPNVLAIKITIYRLAKASRITTALHKAAENGKHVSVLFEVKARFDEENNIFQAERLQKAGCYVIYGLGSIKTHTKLCLIVRKEADESITRYVHISSGNYNEVTSKLYTDISLLTTNETYANDVSEFFNVITGHSQPANYDYLITAPRDMRKQLIQMLRIEAENAKKGLPSGVVIKINSLQDQEFIDELYATSDAGVPIKLIIRGICCLRPHRENLSENIEVKSIVGDLLEHSRIFYFHNNGEPKIYSGSSDAMGRSFDRRVESLFLIADSFLKKEVVNMLLFNLKYTRNSYWMQENGDYTKYKLKEGEVEFDLHKAFFNVNKSDLVAETLF